MWLAKAGFGAFETAFEYAPLVAAARAHGMITTCHTGGSSIPGSGAITGDHLLAMKPHVSFHVNGGPTAMPDKDFERIIVEGDMALQVCTAGNLRTTLLCATLAQRHNAFDRLIIATDTPTGSGIMPLGMLYTMSHLASLGGIAPELCIARGDRQQRAGLRARLRAAAAGKAADIVLLDAPDGGTQDNALAAIRNGDIAAVGAVITAGEPRFVGRSRNTPATTRNVRVASCKVPRDFSGTRHYRPGPWRNRLHIAGLLDQEFREALGLFATGIGRRDRGHARSRPDRRYRQLVQFGLARSAAVLFSLARGSRAFRPGNPWRSSRSMSLRKTSTRHRRSSRVR